MHPDRGEALECWQSIPCHKTGCWHAFSPIQLGLMHELTIQYRSILIQYCPYYQYPTLSILQQLPCWCFDPRTLDLFRCHFLMPSCLMIWLWYPSQDVSETWRWSLVSSLSLGEGYTLLIQNAFTSMFIRKIWKFLLNFPRFLQHAKAAPRPGQLQLLILVLGEPPPMKYTATCYTRTFLHGGGERHLQHQIDNMSPEKPWNNPEIFCTKCLLRQY